MLMAQLWLPPRRPLLSENYAGKGSLSFSLHPNCRLSNDVFRGAFALDLTRLTFPIYRAPRHKLKTQVLACGICEAAFPGKSGASLDRPILLWFSGNGYMIGPG